MTFKSIELWLLVLFYTSDSNTRAALRVLSRGHLAAGERARLKVQRMGNGPGNALVTDLIARIRFWTPWLGMRKLRAPPRRPRFIYNHWVSIKTYRFAYLGEDGRGLFRVVRGAGEDEKRWQIWRDGVWVNNWALYSGEYVPSGTLGLHIHR